MIGIFGEMFLRTIDDAMPGLVHKCPYFGITGFQGVNVDRIMSSMLPQIFPHGMYKFVARLHKANNDTYVSFDYIVNVDDVENGSNKLKG